MPRSFIQLPFEIKALISKELSLDDLCTLAECHYSLKNPCLDIITSPPFSFNHLPLDEQLKIFDSHPLLVRTALYQRFLSNLQGQAHHYYNPRYYRYRGVGSDLKEGDLLPWAPGFDFLTGHIDPDDPSEFHCFDKEADSARESAFLQAISRLATRSTKERLWRTIDVLCETHRYADGYTVDPNSSKRERGRRNISRPGGFQKYDFDSHGNIGITQYSKDAIGLLLLSLLQHCLARPPEKLVLNHQVIERIATNLGPAMNHSEMQLAVSITHTIALFNLTQRQWSEPVQGQLPKSNEVLHECLTSVKFRSELRSEFTVPMKVGTVLRIKAKLYGVFKLLLSNGLSTTTLQRDVVGLVSKPGPRPGPKVLDVPGRELDVTSHIHLWRFQAPFTIACFYRDLELVQFLVESDRGVLELTYDEFVGESPLSAACMFSVMLLPDTLSTPIPIDSSGCYDAEVEVPEIVVVFTRKTVEVIEYLVSAGVYFPKNIEGESWDSTFQRNRIAVEDKSWRGPWDALLGSLTNCRNFSDQFWHRHPICNRKDNLECQFRQEEVPESWKAFYGAAMIEKLLELGLPPVVYHSRHGTDVSYHMEKLPEYIVRSFAPTGTWSFGKDMRNLVPLSHEHWAPCRRLWLLKKLLVDEDREEPVVPYSYRLRDIGAVHAITDELISGVTSCQCNSRRCRASAGRDESSPVLSDEERMKLAEKSEAWAVMKLLIDNGVGSWYASPSLIGGTELPMWTPAERARNAGWDSLEAYLKKGSPSSPDETESLRKEYEDWRSVQGNAK
ncbi:hypothetical protein BJ508DRAFT_347638 [Ascobolus immersus RN42]|uniref:F-box domain-containing protein n=1 Tax=Ascobolus immersus RN42 TaxID=1160509 RepID=A0A3N4IJZ5_ASCIM|nr:hypothetical protein BJ508DRAFT_347638 [Ascobolus immersus RN42]